jgi:Fe-S-cluster containining protein
VLASATGREAPTIVQSALLYNGNVSGGPPVQTYWLSMHVPYACRHVGACCEAGWPIPLERARLAAVAPLRGRDRSWLRVTAAPSEIAGLLATSDAGRCVFRGKDCEIHRRAGHAALPAACQHFPRRAVLDPRGVFVTLSHYCPTAADLLRTHEGPIAIVPGPPAIPDGAPEGLDARDVLPPLLSTRPASPGDRPVLADWDGCTAWEALMVDVLANRGLSPETALAQLHEHLRGICEWTPGHRPLAEVISTRSDPAADAASCAPAGSQDLILGRFLAAHAFASWAPYGTGGLGATLERLRRVLATVRAHLTHAPLLDAIRQTDMEVVHRA